jgi:peptidoglycan/LPS O-acetylase OafA/YrhL
MDFAWNSPGIASPEILPNLFSFFITGADMLCEGHEHSSGRSLLSNTVLSNEFSSPLPPTPAPERLRLAYLDGIRGLAAFYVVLVHCWNFDLAEGLQPALVWLPVTKFLRYGIFAVVIFIVLSGYCLMLPVVRSGQGQLSGGLRGFYKRRIRRIMPPYYAALLICLLISGFTFWVEAITSWRWDAAAGYGLKGLFSPYFSWHDVLAYVLLIQNFGFEETTLIGPSWTIAIEWQIYFLFAVLLLPIWRRYGLRIMLAIAFLVGVTPLYLSRPIFDTACFWFLGLFALGMAAADISFSQRDRLIRLRRSLPWMGMAIGFTGLAFFTEWLRFRMNLDEWVIHTILGLGVACFLVDCTHQLTGGQTVSPVLRWLEFRWVVALGTISYSLYIIHAPVVFIVHQGLLNLSLAPPILAFLLLLLGTGFSLWIAYLFYCAFERPFMAHFSSRLKS